ncbi:hypothetical protein BU15DRAFT_63911 [Melanogaster broomeanus]|nr:hypothetical protein BU15DRAFT_63911 [Melanogaster broomeanus]
MSHEAAMMVYTDEAFSKIEELYADYPPEANDAATIAIVSWFNAEILAHIDMLEEATPNSSSEESGGVPQLINPAEPRLAEALARGGADARRHPASMRKRVAGNQRAQKSAREKTAPGPLPALVPPPLHPLYAAYTTPAPTAYLSAIANAEELRRRKRQLGRDRKKHHAAMAIPR